MIQNGRLLKRSFKMNGEAQTWVNLLTKESGSRNECSKNGDIGITVTSQTPRNLTTKRSRVKDERTGESEVLRSQVVSLLKEKKDMMKKTQADSQIKKALQEELKTLKENKSSANLPNHSTNEQTASLEMQVLTLREALDAVTREKNLLKHQLAQQPAGNINCKSPSITSEEDFGVRLQLSQLRDALYTVEHERDALKDRLGGIEMKRQESMEQYQHEVETSMMEVTNQLEELLHLNQQLQKELSTVQKEKDELINNLRKERKERQVWEREKSNHSSQLERFENQTTKLNDDLQIVKDEMLQQTTSSLAAIEALQLQVSEANESTNQVKSCYKNCQTEVQRLKGEMKEMERNRDEADRALLDLQHHLTLVRQERDSLQNRLQTSQMHSSKLKQEFKVNEERAVSTESNVSKLLKDLEANRTDLTTVKTQLAASEQECRRLKKELGISQKHCKQQVENLTQQLMQKATKQTELETDTIHLQSRIKKLESKIHEMAFNHEVHSAKHEGNLRNAMSNLDSTITQLETTETSNTQLQQKILDLEEEVAGWRKQLMEREGVCHELRELVEEKNRRICQLEETVAKLHESITTSSDSGTEAVLAQIQTLKNGIKQVQRERDDLNTRLQLELERVETSAETEKTLREENTRLQDLLNTSMSISEKLQSSLDLSHMDSSNPATPNSSPSKLSPCKISTSALSSSSPKYTSLTQFGSPATEVLHLKQLLAEGRQMCLNLQRQHAHDKTEMAKIQGSLQALVQIQDHLSTENKSVAETLSTVIEEREAYKQEAMKSSNELSSLQQELEQVTTMLEHFKENLASQLTELIENVEVESEFHDCLQEHLKELEESQGLNILRIVNSVLEAFLDFASNQSIDTKRSAEESIKQEAQEKLESLQQKVVALCGQVEEVERELQHQCELVQDKEREIMDCKGELEELNQQGLKHSKEYAHVENYKKDVDAEYQAKLSVVRENLIEREQEVASLRMAQLEGRERMSLMEEELDLLRTDLEGRRAEEFQIKGRLVRYETTMRTEDVLMDNEINKQTSDITALTNEAREIEDACRITATINTSQQEQLSKCAGRISQLQAEVEMLRAKKTVISKYLSTHDASRDEQSEKEREELIQENDQLIMENDDLRQELSTLTDTTGQLNEMVEILRLRLEEVQEEFDEDRLNHADEIQSRNEVNLHDQMRHRCALLETDLETERIKVRRIESEREVIIAELRTLEGQLAVANNKQTVEMKSLQEELQKQSLMVEEMQITLEDITREKEELERKLTDTSMNCSITSKVSKLKAKFKQQVKQTNYLRMKLGYSISELRLHKQLKSELDSQIAQLQNALTLSQQQHKQCLEKLLLAERLTVNSPPLSTHREI